MTIIARILSLFTGGAAGAVSHGVVNAISVTAMIPAVVWALDNVPRLHDALAVPVITVTLGDAAVIGAALAFVLKLAHYLRSPVA